MPLHSPKTNKQGIKMGIALSLFIVMLLVLAATSHSSPVPNQIHLLMPRSGAAGLHIDGVNCLSWRLAVETDNIKNWKVVPEDCADYVGHYMLGQQYRDDCDAVVDSAITYANSLTLSGDGKDIWVFDIDETALSNLPYYARPDVAFGAKKYDREKFGKWLEEGNAPAVPGVVKLYNELVNLGIKVVFLTGSSELYRDARTKNLKDVGYHTWEKLILKAVKERGTSSVAFKSKKREELEAQGYRIVGNMGDQWSDLIGSHVGDRTFKLPDPMYYVG